MSSPPRLAARVCIAILCCIWGSTWIVIQGGLRDLPPFTSAAARFGIAALAMTCLAAVLHRREGGRAPAWWLSLVVGVTNFGMSYGVVYWSETRLPSGIVSVLWSVFPLMMAISGHFFLAGGRLVAAQWLGFVVGFGGVVMLLETDLHRFGTTAIPAALILFTSPLVSVLGTTILKKYGENTSSLLVNRNAMWIGAGLLGALAFAVERDRSVAWTTNAWLSVLYLSIVGTTIAFGLYFWLLRHTPAHHLSLVSYVTPAIALFLGAVFGGEELTGFTIAGTAMILAGVWLVMTKRRPWRRWRAQQAGGTRGADELDVERAP